MRKRSTDALEGNVLLGATDGGAPFSGTSPGALAGDPTETERRPTKAARKEVSYANEIMDMMFVFGDGNVRSGTGETVPLVEAITRDYIISLLTDAAGQVHRSGGLRITVDHVLFQIRKDAPIYYSLKEFLQWKDIRNKNFTQDDMSGKEHKKGTKALMQCNWEMLTGLGSNDEEEKNLLEDDTSLKAALRSKNQKRLRQADEITKNMSKEEYMRYTEARKASFTYKKAKKFRDWLGPVASIIKFNDDVLEALGYLAWEMVGSLTQLALTVKKEMETHKLGYGHRRLKSSILNLNPTPNQHGEKMPLLPVHIREALRRMQPLSYSAVGFTAARVRGRERFL